MNVILPIGSVVKLRKTEKPVMIFGYLQKSIAAKNNLSDYLGVPYPEGNINICLQIGFQMDDIDQVLFEGYRTEAFEPWAKVLEIKRKNSFQEECGD